jgi:hypothetical protein
MTLRLRWWESALLVPFILLAGLFVLSGEFVAAVVLVALLVVVIASRAQIRERNVAGGYARSRGWLEYFKAVALFAIYCVIVFFFFVSRHEHWTRDTRGTVAIWSLGGLAFFLLRDIRRIGDGANNWLLGGEMEREVARVLEPLRQEGWLVTHDIKKDRGGNVDHFVSGPNGAFAIETKRGTARAADRNQAIWNAVWAKEKFGQRWVTAVLCVGTDPPQQPRQQGHVWILGPRDLLGFLRIPAKRLGDAHH